MIDVKKQFALICSILMVSLCFSACAEKASEGKDKLLNTIESVSNNLNIDTTSVIDKLNAIDVGNLENNNESIIKAQDALKEIDLTSIKEMVSVLQTNLTEYKGGIDDIKNNLDTARNMCFEDTEAYDYIIFEYEPLAWGIETFSVTSEKTASLLSVAGKDYDTYYRTLSTTGTLEKGHTTKEGTTYRVDFLTKKESEVQCLADAEVLTYVFNNVQKWEYVPIVFTAFAQNYTNMSINTFECGGYVVNLFWNKETGALNTIFITDKENADVNYTFVVKHLMTVDEVNTFVK